MGKKRESSKHPILVGWLPYKQSNSYLPIIEEALVEKYAEMIVTSHAESCLWRQRGCDGKC
jgi:hypothetical protein